MVNKRLYKRVHEWVYKTMGKAHCCEQCGLSSTPISKKRSYFQWANISGMYKWEKLDWKQLCVPCHQSFDSTGLEKGEKHSHAKLTESQVISIRAMYVPYKYPMKRLANEFGVGVDQINKIVHRIVWRHI